MKNKLIGILCLLVVVETLALTFVLKNRTQQKAPIPDASLSVPESAPTLPATDGTERIRTLEEELAALRTQYTELEAQLTSKDDLLAQQKQELEALGSEVDTANSEILFSYGTLSESGEYLGNIFASMNQLSSLDKNSEEYETISQELGLSILSMGPLLEEVKSIESNPEAFAEFQASYLTTFMKMDASMKPQVEEIIRKYKALALNHKKKSKQYQALNNQAREEVSALLSEEEKKNLAIPYSVLDAGMGMEVSVEEEE